MNRTITQARNVFNNCRLLWRTYRRDVKTVPNLTYLSSVPLASFKQSSSVFSKRQNFKSISNSGSKNTQSGSSGKSSAVVVGSRASITKTFTAADVQAFADVTGDSNPLHLDEAYAATTRFGRRIVHGTLSIGYFVYLDSVYLSLIIKISKYPTHYTYISSVARHICASFSFCALIKILLSGNQSSVDDHLHKSGGTD